MSKAQFCQQVSCTRKVLPPHIYCDNHKDISSTPSTPQKSGVIPKCSNSKDGSHLFACVIPRDEVTESDKAPINAQQLHTCVACGHRRAIDIVGKLWVFFGVKEGWKQITDLEVQK